MPYKKILAAAVLGGISLFWMTEQLGSSESAPVLGKFRVGAQTTKFTRAILGELNTNTACKMSEFIIGQPLPYETSGVSFHPFNAVWYCAEEDKARRWVDQIAYFFKGEIRSQEGAVPTIEENNFEISYLSIEITPTGGSALFNQETSFSRINSFLRKLPNRVVLRNQTNRLTKLLPNKVMKLF